MSLAYHYDVAGDAQAEFDGKISSEEVTWFLSWKAVVDVAVASALLILTAPLVLLVILVVKANSPGPSLFKQVRSGRGFRSYVLYKILSMV